MHQGGLTFLVLLGHLITFRGWQERGWGHVLKGTPRSLGSRVAVYHTELLATWGWGAFCLDPTRSQKSVKNNSNCGSKAQVQKPAWASHERACRGPGGGRPARPPRPRRGAPAGPTHEAAGPWRPRAGRQWLSDSAGGTRFLERPEADFFLKPRMADVWGSA